MDFYQTLFYQSARVVFQERLTDIRGNGELIKVKDVQRKNDDYP